MLGLRRLFLDTKLFFKRIFWRFKFGFDITDTWNLDYSLAEWLEPRVRHLANNTHGHPHDFTEQEWHMYLITIANRIKRYLNAIEKSDTQEELEAYESYKIAMQMFTDRLHDMWD